MTSDFLIVETSTNTVLSPKHNTGIQVMKKKEISTPASEMTKEGNFAMYYFVLYMVVEKKLLTDAGDIPKLFLV